MTSSRSLLPSSGEGEFVVLVRPVGTVCMVAPVCIATVGNGRALVGPRTVGSRCLKIVGRGALSLVASIRCVAARRAVASVREADVPLGGGMVLLVLASCCELGLK